MRSASRVPARSSSRNVARPNSTSSTTTSPSRDHAHDSGSRHDAPAVPRWGQREVLLPEARARQRPRVVAADVREHAQRHPLERVGGRRHGAPHLGREPRLSGLPPVAVPRRDARDHRRAAHRSRPDPGADVRRHPGRRVRGQSVPRRDRHRRLPEDERQSRPAHLRAARAAVGQLRRPRRRGRDGPGARTSSPRPAHGGVVEGGAGHRSSSTSTRTLRTRRCSARGRFVPASAARCRHR